MTDTTRRRDELPKNNTRCEPFLPLTPQLASLPKDMSWEVMTTRTAEARDEREAEYKSERVQPCLTSPRDTGTRSGSPTFCAGTTSSPSRSRCTTAMSERSPTKSVPERHVLFSRRTHHALLVIVGDGLRLAQPLEPRQVLLVEAPTLLFELPSGEPPAKGRE